MYVDLLKWRRAAPPLLFHIFRSLSRAARTRVLPWRELRRKRAWKGADCGANKNVSYGQLDGCNVLLRWVSGEEEIADDGVGDELAVVGEAYVGSDFFEFAILYIVLDHEVEGWVGFDEFFFV